MPPVKEYYQVWFSRDKWLVCEKEDLDLDTWIDKNKGKAIKIEIILLTKEEFDKSNDIKN